MKICLLLPLVCFLLACAKEDPAAPSPLVGTWRLKTYCKSQTGGGCTLTSVPADKTVTVIFSGNGEFRETYSNTKYEGYGFLGGSGTYAIEGSNVRIQTAFMSSLGGVVHKIVSVDANRLVLNRDIVGDFEFVR
jgi:hypothetical protein